VCRKKKIKKDFKIANVAHAYIMKVLCNTGRKIMINILLSEKEKN